jgi:hypothetical protein
VSEVTAAQLAVEPDDRLWRELEAAIAMLDAGLATRVMLCGFPPEQAREAIQEAGDYEDLIVDAAVRPGGDALDLIVRLAPTVA